MSIYFFEKAWYDESGLSEKKKLIYSQSVLVIADKRFTRGLLRIP